MNETNGFQELLNRITRKDFPEDKELIPFLILPDVEDRQQVNHLLASAYAVAGNFEMAKTFTWRANRIGPFRLEVFSLANQIINELGDFEAGLTLCRNAVSLSSAASNKDGVYEALKYYYRNCGILTHQRPEPLDPNMDPAIDEALGKVFGKPQVDALPLRPLANRKIRIGYMLWGEKNIQNVLVRNVMTLVRHHDSSEFEVLVYSYWSATEILKSNPDIQKLIDEIERAGAKFRLGIEDADTVARIYATRESIVQDSLDMMIFSSQTYMHKALTQLGCAPIQASLNQGNPRAYTSPLLDFSIVPTIHGQMEALCKSHLFTFGIDEELISRMAGDGGSLSKTNLGIEEEQVMLFSSGRDYKFNSAKFWALVHEVLQERQNAVWVCAGVDNAQLDRFGIAIEEDIADRVLLLGWRDDVSSNLIPVSDIIVDTFPAGGGYSLYEGMLTAKPCLSFLSNYMREFTNNDWSPAFEPFSGFEFAFPYGRSNLMKDKILELIDDKYLRSEVGQLCRKAVKSMTDSRKFVAQVEAVYREAIEKKFAQSED